MIEGLIDRKGKVSDQGGDVWIIFFLKYEEAGSVYKLYGLDGVV